MTDRPLDLSSYAREGWQLIKKDYRIVLPSVLSIFAMMLVTRLMVSPESVPQEVNEEMIKSLIALAFVSFIFSSFAHGVTVGMVREMLERGSTSMGSAGVIALRMLPQLLGVSSISAFLIVAGLTLFIIPGFLAWMLVIYAMPALIMHGGGSLAALGRSIALARARTSASAMLFGYVMFANLFVAAVGIALAGIPVLGQLITIVNTSVVGAIVAVMELRAYLALTGIVLVETTKAQPEAGSR